MEGLDLRLSREEAEGGEKIDRRGRFDWEGFLEKNKLSVGLAAVGLFLLGIGVLAVLALSSQSKNASIEILPAKEAAKETASPAKEIFIHLAGAVEKPGLYQLPAGARINEALIAAGGLAARADRKWLEKNINLAQKLSDGIKIYIPFQGEKKPSQTSVLGIQSPEGKLNLNTASAAQLESLPGIGAAKAQKIIDYRQQEGFFSQIEDIIKVPGIGEKIFEQIKDKITVF